MLAGDLDPFDKALDGGENVYQVNDSSSQPRDFAAIVGIATLAQTALAQSPSPPLKWRVERGFVLVPAQGFVAQHLATPGFPAAAESLDQVLASLQDAGGASKH
jgi:hypothetical protein